FPSGPGREAGTAFCIRGTISSRPNAQLPRFGMTQVLQRTVLFADLRGSTAMYETLGNAEATAVVSRSVALLARIVTVHGGHVIKTLGDGLMAVFELPKQGVSAADDMHDSLSRIGMADDVESAPDSEPGSEEAYEGGAAAPAPRPT